MEIEKVVPKVSVIIPVYDVEEYIERCARSLFEQTLDSIEYLFIDDCSPDDSIKVLLSLLEEYPNRKDQIVIHRMGKNSGQAAVRKWGVLNAKGEYIIHCDSDDWVEVDMYEKLYNKAVSEDSDIVICDYYIDNGLGEKRYVKCYNGDARQNDFFRQALLQNIGAAVWNKLIKRNLISGEQIMFAPANMGEDYVLVIQYMFYANHVTIINEPLYHYFFNDNSITKSKATEKVLYRFNQSVINMDTVVRFIGREGVEKKYQDELDRIKYYKRNNILPIISDRKYYIIWKNTFPEINSRVLKNQLLSFREKVKYILIYFRLLRN